MSEAIETFKEIESNIEDAVLAPKTEAVLVDAEGEAVVRDPGPLTESGWVAVAFVIFVVLFVKKVWPFIAKALDDRSEQIKNELAEAEALKNEAQGLLAEAQRKSAETEKAAVEMVATAKAEAKRIAQQAGADMNEEADRKLELVKKKIKRAEQQAIENVKKEAIEEATKIAAQSLASASAKNHKSLLTDSIAKITSSIN